MKTLSLDIATTTGWALFEGSQLVSYGKFTVSGANHQDKVKSLSTHLTELLATHNPAQIILEDVYAGPNWNTTKLLTLYQSVVLLLAPCDVELITASQWKSTAEVKGRGRVEQKRGAQEKVKLLYGVKATQDEVDSILIGHHKVATELNFE